MIRLLMLIANRPRKGTFWRSFGFARELARREFDVTFLAVAPQRRYRFTEQRVDRVRLIETPDLFPSAGYDLLDTLARIG